ncbi:MAG: cyclase family protein [Thermaerobacter sp.]|nr:cyclase family protein [Thermaerobacter sp.]MDA8205959.1 cyclase family protein [Thermaerobacter sp.]
MTRYLLSHPLGERTPVYRDNPPVEVRRQHAIDRGDPFDQSWVGAVTHSGTHMDCPRHFNPEGLAVSQLTADQMVFNHIVVADVPTADDGLITAARLIPLRDRLEVAELLLIRTGFGAVRQADPHRYGWHNPGFDESAGQFLLKFRALRAVGLDTPSASAAQHLEAGLLFHQAVLGTHRPGAPPFFILEDVDLSLPIDYLDRVYVVPLMIEGVDSGPCTILAEVDQVHDDQPGNRGCP